MVAGVGSDVGGYHVETVQAVVVVAAVVANVGEEWHGHRVEAGSIVVPWQRFKGFWCKLRRKHDFLLEQWLLLLLLLLLLKQIAILLRNAFDECGGVDYFLGVSPGQFGF